MTQDAPRFAMWLGCFSLALACAACGSNNETSSDNNATADMGQAEMDVQDLGDQDQSETPDEGTPEEDMGTEIIGDPVNVVEFAMLPPVPGNCTAPNARYRVPFLLSTDALVPAKPGDVVDGRPLEANTSITAGSIVSRRTRVSDISIRVCETDADCQTGFLCGAAGVAGADRYCTRQTGFEFIPGTVQMDVDPGNADKNQVVSLLVDNTSSLTGFLPREVGNRFDENGEQDNSEDDFRATDPELESRRTVKQFIEQLASIADPNNTLVSVWSFTGDSPVFTVPLTPASSAEVPNDYFTRDLSIARDVIDNLPQPTDQRGTGNVYQAILRVIDRDLALDKYAEHEKFLFVVTDGANEVYDPMSTYEIVRDRLIEHGIHLYVLHFDPEIDPARMRDFPSLYLGGQACRGDDSCTVPTCSSDGDCQSHQSCRPATVYGMTSSDVPADSAESYCLPDFDGGILGPVDHYSELTCLTGGSYIYVNSIDQLRVPMRIVPSAIDGRWSVEADISLLDTGKGTTPGYYRISGVFVGLFGQDPIGSRLSSRIPDENSVTGGTVDTRQTVRVGQ